MRIYREEYKKNLDNLTCFGYETTQDFYLTTTVELLFEIRDLLEGIGMRNKKDDLSEFDPTLD